jgi:hypothetical protein
VETAEKIKMKKQNLLNIGLLALIGVLVFFTVYEPGIKKPTETPTLLQLDKGEVKEITIIRDGQQEIELVRQDNDHWDMLAPIQHAADQFRIDSLLRITTLKSLGSFSTDPDKLAAYQLDKPRVTLILNHQTRIAFGSSTPLDQRRYVMVNGQVHLITDTLYYHLIGSFPTFLRKQLLDEGSSIEALTLPDLKLNWQEERWQLDPKPESFSADQVTRLIDQWKFASALDIKPYDKKPGEKITITLSGQEQPLELLLTAQKPDLILARPELGIQYHLDAASAERLLKLPPREDEKKTEDGEPAAADTLLEPQPH